MISHLQLTFDLEVESRVLRLTLIIFLKINDFSPRYSGSVCRGNFDDHMSCQENRPPSPAKGASLKLGQKEAGIFGAPAKVMELSDVLVGGQHDWRIQEEWGYHPKHVLKMMFFLLFLDGLTLVQHDFDVDLCSQSQSQGFRRKW